ncbi:hypothetical protein J2810_001162 [Chryseobacterium rhizosphaerae]|nr:hypothetical protein [Chryseobacterium rhizosphaerae]
MFVYVVRKNTLKNTQKKLELKSIFLSLQSLKQRDLLENGNMKK